MKKSLQRLHNEDLVLRCQGEDAAAFEELVSRWQVRLWKHAVRLTQDQDAAWDVVQDSWLAIIKGIGGLDVPAAFPAWAFRIVSNKCADWVRKRQRWRKNAEEIASETETVSRHPMGPLQQADSLTVALRSLPGDRRAILALRYVEGFGVNEISAILEIPPGTVKSRLYHARNQLKRIMEEEEHE
jgi:RNA polymerase sigma-70 factor (ECF subfamily)